MKERCRVDNYMMKCSICGSSPLIDGISIYRNGPKGEKVEWRCLQHLDKEFKDKLIQTIAVQIESLQNPSN